MLNTPLTGAPPALPPLLSVHGLFGSARNWRALATRVADSRLVITVDMRNHGESPWYPTHSYPDLAADLAEIAAPYPPLDVLGHSMGGKAAMMLALTRPGHINRLLIADIAPVPYSHQQSQLTLITAMQALDLSATSRRIADDGLATSVPDPAVRAFLLQSLDFKSTPPRWRLNLETLGREIALITGWPDVAGHFPGHVLFLSGALSDYILPDHRAAIKALFPAARFAELPGAGHWLHAEKPHEFEATLRAWFG